MRLQAYDCGPRACFHPALARIRDLETIAENKLQKRKRAGRHRMYNGSFARADLSLGVELYVFAERGRGTADADTVHYTAMETLLQKYSSAGRPVKKPAYYRASQLTKLCHAELGPITPARSGPDMSIVPATPHVSG